MGGMKVSKKTANIIMLAGAGLGLLLFFGMKLVYPRIAERLGNPTWLGGTLTAVIIGAGILGAIHLFRQRNPS
jgi:hypothetical protein